MTTDDGMTLLRAGRFAEAAASFRQALTLAPPDARLLFGLGEALAGQGDEDGAIAAYEAAIAADPANVPARYQLGATLHRTGRLEAAEKVYRELLLRVPDHLPTKLALGAVLVDALRPAEAESVLGGALHDPGPPALRAMLRTTHGLALRRQRKDQAAFDSYEEAARLEPALPGLAVHRAEALQNLHRYDDALAMYRAALARDPGDVQAHRHYNDLLYRLGSPDYLASYDQAPRHPAFLLDKALLLTQSGRHEEAHAAYRDAAALGARQGGIGAATALMKLGRLEEAQAEFAALLTAPDPALCSRAAELQLLRGDAKAALALCEQGLALSPFDQSCLAMSSLALRLLKDERDEALNGYERLIQVFDLAPPDGFASMADFNAELERYLDRLHPHTREHAGQSLRGGTQTADHVFRAGHDLIDRLEERISETVRAFVEGLPGDAAHPFAARRGRGLRYAGSWSSRLSDCGFHVNHIHPQGWISSCYYVGVPGAVRDTDAKQGWIKFGEPSFDVPLSDPIRRAVQPVPGRLVLFPSYMWHGTVPFRDTARRTTIAFDVVPV